MLSQNEAWAQKVFRFLAFVNQSDWGAEKIIKLIDLMQDEGDVSNEVAAAEHELESKNKQRTREDKPLIRDSDLEALRRIPTIGPVHLGVIDAADNWVVDDQKDLGRFPNYNEWHRLLSSPLDGLVGMSFALQWSYDFGKLFGARQDDPTTIEPLDE